MYEHYGDDCWMLSVVYVQPLSPVVSRGNELHNMNSPSASLLNIRKIIRICVRTLHILVEATI